MQANLYRAQKQAYDASIKQKEKELKEIQTVINSLNEEIAKLRSLLIIISDEEKRLKSLSEAGAIAEARYREKVKERLNLEKEIQVKKSQIEENTLRLEIIKHKIDAIRSGFSEKLLAEASNSIQQENLLISEITTIKFKESKRFITSPVNGYVHLLPVKTVGGVVTPAQPIITIVPENTPLVVRVIVLNKDIGFVKEKTRAVIKIDTYDFQKYGTLQGEVEVISPFSIEDREIGVDGYPVYVKLYSTELKTKDGKTYKVKAGMTVTAEINVGKRRVIELILSPFLKHIDEGLSAVVNESSFKDNPPKHKTHEANISIATFGMIL